MDILNFVIYALELVSIFLIIHVAFRARIKLNPETCVTLLSSICLMYVAYLTQITAVTYVAHVIVLLYCRYEFQNTWWNTFWKFLGAVAICSIIETIVLMNARGWLHASKHVMLPYVWISFGMLVCAAIIYWMFIQKQISLVTDTSDRNFIIGVFVINVFILYVKEDGQGKLLRLFVCLLSVLLLIIKLVVILRKGKNAKEFADSEWLRQYAEQYDELIQEVRRRQHDYKNEIQAIKSVCASSDNCTATMDVLGECEEADRYTSLLNGCENPLVAGLIYSKAKEFEERKVLLKCQIRLRNKKLSIRTKDMIDVLGIILDNSFECTLEQNRNVIYLDVQEWDGFVLFQTGNPSNYISTSEIEKMFALGYSTKGKNRGIGLHTVKESVNKCGGRIIAGNQPMDGCNFFFLQIQIPFAE